MKTLPFIFITIIFKCYSDSHLKYDIKYGTNLNHIETIAQIYIQEDENNGAGFISIAESGLVKIKRFSEEGVYYHHNIQEAINAASEFDTICLSPGIYIENIIIDKPGITIQGSGSGNESYDNEEAINVAGGTIISGYIRVEDEGINCKLERLSFTPNNPNQSPEYNLAFFGSHGDILYDGIINDVAFYGDGFCAHNVEFRGQKWDVRSVRSYNAGIHNFVIKSGKSTFRDLLIDNKGNTNASFLFIKSHNDIAALGSPKDTIIDGFKVIMSGETYYSGIYLNNADNENECIDNIAIRNGIIENKTSNNYISIRLLGKNYANNIIKNIRLENIICLGGTTGVFLQDGLSNFDDRGIDSVFLSNCSFMNQGEEELNYGIYNSEASNVFLNMVVLKNFANARAIRGIFAEQNIHILND